MEVVGGIKDPLDRFEQVRQHSSPFPLHVRDAHQELLSPPFAVALKSLKRCSMEASLSLYPLSSLRTFWVLTALP